VPLHIGYRLLRLQLTHIEVDGDSVFWVDISAIKHFSACSGSAYAV